MSINDAIWRAKQLCEIPNGRMGARIVRELRRKGEARPSQLESWCMPMGHSEPTIRERFKDLVGQIFFKFDDRTLDSQDREVLDAALDYWRSYNANYYRRTAVLFKFVGNADHRGHADYNMTLGRERADVVKRVFDRAFSGYPSYLGVAESQGEFNANKKDPTESRRVDIFTNFVIPMDRAISFENRLVLGTYRGERSRKFKMRVLGGAGLSIGPVGGNLLTIEILDPRTDRTAMYRLSSISTGVSVGLNRPTAVFSDIDTKDHVSIDDFEGNGGIIGISIGIAGGQLLRFDGPKERGVTTKSVVVPLTGWDLNVGMSSDVVGYWHRVGD